MTNDQSAALVTPSPSADPPVSIGYASRTDSLGSEEVARLVDYWKTNMRPHLPFLSDLSSPGATSTTQPILYLAILTAASSAILPDSSPDLAKRLMETLTNAAYVDCHASEEIIEALLIYHFFPIPHGSARFRLMPHAHIASVMARDLGLNEGRLKLASQRSELDAYQSARLYLGACIASLG